MTQDRDHTEQAGPPAGSPNESDEVKGAERADATPAKKRRWRLTRRGFLIGLGAAGASLAVGAYLGRPVLHEIMAESMAEAEHAGSGFMQLPDDPPLWLEVLEDSRIRLSLTKVEMGQGVHTSIAQIAVEELGISSGGQWYQDAVWYGRAANWAGRRGSCQRVYSSDGAAHSHTTNDAGACFGCAGWGGILNRGAAR